MKKSSIAAFGAAACLMTTALCRMAGLDLPSVAFVFGGGCGLMILAAAWWGEGK